MSTVNLLEVDDPTGMIQQLYDFLGDIDHSINEEIDFDADYDNIAICGMGGSAIGGSILSDAGFQISDIPIEVIEFPELPKWVGKRTLTIISSYSGNTHETLMMYDQALERDCQMVVLTSGGKIREKAVRDGIMIVPLKGGIQPRSAIGATVGAMANLVETTGGPKFRTEIKKVLPNLYKLRDRLVIGDSKNVAVKAAKRISGKVPVIYASPMLIGSAYRWKTQINENSKMMAFSGTIPESNHNDIMWWTEGSRRDSFQIVLFQEDESSKLMKKLLTVTASTLRDKGMKPLVLRIRGRTAIERSLRAIMIGDFVSIYLAYYGGVDPAQVNTITSLKSRFQTLLGYMDKRKQKKARRKDEEGTEDEAP